MFSVRQNIISVFKGAVPWFDPCLAHVTFLVDKGAFFPSAFVSPVSIIPPMAHTDLPLNTTLFRWTSGRSFGTLKHGSSYIVEHMKEKYCRVVYFCLQRVKLFWDMYLLFWFKRRGVKHEETASVWGYLYLIIEALPWIEFS